MRKQQMSSAKVRHYLPGGRESGGGIGRLVGYIVDGEQAKGTCHALCDTRGSSWSPARSLGHLCAAIAQMSCDRMTAPRRIHHIHVAGRGSTARKLILTAVARSLGCTHLLHLHDYDYAEDYARRPPWQQRWIRHMFRGADEVVVLGQRDRRVVKELLEVDANRITVLHNAVSDPGSRARSAREQVRIVFLGRLSERKGVPELLAAFASPTMAELNWHATLAGDGPVDAYRREAEALGLRHRVSMPGWLTAEETARLCAEGDILVLPSRSEGMAMAVLEGLAHGMPVVATRVGAHEEAITDGANGVFVPVGDVAALADALAALVADPARRARLSRAARDLYLTRFSIPTYLRRLDELHGALLEPRELPKAAQVTSR